MRLLAFGSRTLMDGFNLLGFETYPEANPSIFEEALCELLSKKEKALVFVEQNLLVDTGNCYQKIRQDSGEVVLMTLPPLNEAENYHPPVEELVKRVLGPSALGD